MDMNQLYFKTLKSAGALINSKQDLPPLSAATTEVLIVVL